MKPGKRHKKRQPRDRADRGARPEVRRAAARVGGERNEPRADTPPRQGRTGPVRRRDQPVAPAPSRDSRAGALWLYGRHAVLAALANPQRRIKRVLAVESALVWIAEARVKPERLVHLRQAAPGEIERALHAGAVHQGLAAEVEDLPRARLKEACQPDRQLRPVLALDQITDPHNIGAIFRSAAAFGVRAIIVQDRRTPPLAGALAKAAAGAVELVPCVEVVNIARALEGLKALGYYCAGLAGEAPAGIDEMPKDRPVALVLGAEGSGLRQLVAATCDGLFRIPIDRRMDSLNVSNAAAIALYQARLTGK